MRNSHTHSFGCDKTRRTIIGRFSNSRVWLFAWMAIATTLLGRTLLSPGPAPLELASASMHVELRSAGHRADGRTATVHSFRPIESLRVGDRVVADNPDTATPEQTAVDPATWRLVKLYAEETWPDGTLDTIHIETLQPPEWLELFGAEQGAEVPPPIDLVEMGLPEDLDTTVVGIEPCPRIQPGPGRVVLTTVNHLNNDVWELTAVNSAGHHEHLRPTGFHKFYSDTRRDWVSTKEIHDNEVIRGRAGPLAVVATRKLPGTERVYNLTVEGEHVYYVSELALLAHNTCNFVAVDDIAVQGHRNIELTIGAAESLGSLPRPGTRQTAINRAWQLEAELVRRTGRGSRNWTVGELAQIRSGVSPTQIRSARAPQGYTGHHINRVADARAWQGDPRNIHFLSRGSGREHMRIGHPGGTSAIQPPGTLIDREALLRGNGI